MDYCRSVLAVAGANFRRLKRDARVWFIFVFTALLIHYYLRPVINYGKVLGKDISMPDRIGAIIENPGFLPEYSGFKNLKFLAMIHHKISNEEIRNAMRIVGLDPDSKKHVGKYSLGMRQRLGIAQAIMEDPDILLLDEPLNGLDNEGVEEIRKVLLSLKEKEKLIILASHSKEDIQILCDTVFRMDHGKIIATETN